LYWANDRLRLVRFESGALSIEAEVVLPGVNPPQGLSFDLDAGTVLFAEGSHWARLPLAAGMTQPAPPWTKSQSFGFQAANGLWLHHQDMALFFLPANPAVPRVDLGGPTNWIVAHVEGTRPVLHPFGLDLPSRADLRQALVPFRAQGRVVFGLYQAPGDSELFEVVGNRLRASAHDQHFLFAVPDF
jgi:hypothetical protein